MNFSASIFQEEEEKVKKKPRFFGKIFWKENNNKKCNPTKLKGTPSGRRNRFVIARKKLTCKKTQPKFFIHLPTMYYSRVLKILDKAISFRHIRENKVFFKNSKHFRFVKFLMLWIPSYLNTETIIYCYNQLRNRSF